MQTWQTIRGNKGPIDLCSTGKHHESIKGRNLFRFIPMDNVVPPILHITLGIDPCWIIVVI